MAEGDITLYNAAKLMFLNGDVDLANAADTIQVTLHNGYSPDIDADAVWTDVSASEYSTGSGYTAGGQALANQATAQDNTNDRASFDADPVTWTSLGPLTPATPSHAIIWDNTHASDALLCYVELGVKATNGGNYTLAWHANGIILLT